MQTKPDLLSATAVSDYKWCYLVELNLLFIFTKCANFVTIIMEIAFIQGTLSLFHHLDIHLVFLNCFPYCLSFTQKLLANKSHGFSRLVNTIDPPKFQLFTFLEYLQIVKKNEYLESGK